MKGYIYKLYDNTNENVYYGSTRQQLSKRINDHSGCYKRYLKGTYNYCKSFDIIKNCDYSYNIVEEVEYDERWELLKKEREYIENNVCVNKMIPFRTTEEIKENQRKIDAKHRKTEKYKTTKKRYTENNKEERKLYIENNKEKIKEYQKKYREEHKKEAKEYQKEYQEKHNQKITCECGCVVAKQKLPQHKRTIKHQQWIQSQS